MKRILTLLAAIVAAVPLAFAGPVLTLTPPDISAGHGTPGGWGVTISNLTTDYTAEETPAWIMVSAAAFDELTFSGTFHDLTPLVGIPIALDSTYSQAFDGSNPNPAAWTGLGWFEVNAGVEPPTVLSGTISIFYDAYTGDPTAGGEPVAFGLSMTAPATVTILAPAEAEVPEPSTAALALLALAGIGWGWRRARG